MKLVLLSVESGKPAWFQEGRDEYSEKISRFMFFEAVFVKSKSIDRESSELKRVADSEAIISKIKPDDFVIVCDEKGRSFDSLEFAKKFGQGLESGKARIVVVIGGPYGISEELRKRAQFVWSLGPLVFNHHVAALVVLEQLYRAFTIRKGLPYHNV